MELSRSFVRAGSILLGINALIAIFAAKHGYLIHSRYFSFPAQDPFKPLLLVNAALIISFLVRRGTAVTGGSSFEWGRVANGFTIAIVTICANLPTFAVNFWDHDWTHRHIGADLNSWAKAGALFVQPQADGMYRPLGLLSFGLDYRIFGDHLWGYHLQSVLIHAINALLVRVLARRIGMSPAVSFVAAMAFGTLAIHFEAVLWPAARFDLLAAMFVLVSIILFLDFMEKRERRAAVLSLAAFGLSVLCKESGYCLVVLLPALAVWRGHLRKALPYFAALVVLTGVLFAARLSVLHGAGGYEYQTGGSVTADISWKAVYSLVTNVIALTPFAQNTALASPVVVCIGAAWVLFAAVLMWRSTPDDPRTRRWLLLLALLSVLPALPVIAWIRPNLQHTRHLYLPSVWICLLIATALSRMDKPRTAALAFLLIQCAALNWNVGVYRKTGLLTESAAAAIGPEITNSAKRIRLVSIPPYQNGVWYFDSELQHQVQLTARDTPVVLCTAELPCTAADGDLVYGWDADFGRLKRVGNFPP